MYYICYVAILVTAGIMYFYFEQYFTYNFRKFVFGCLNHSFSFVATAFILSVAESYNWKSAIFSWICCITDFFGIFFVVSFAFYVPPNLEENESNPFVYVC